MTASQDSTLTYFGIELSDALTIILALIGLAIAIVIPWTQTRLARRQLTVSLHDAYWSIDTYLKVIAPAYAVGKKWLALPDAEQREEYRKLVLQGWASHLTGSEELALYLGTEIDTDDPPRSHFGTPVGNDRLTEHQALTRLLYWWSHLAVYYRNRLVDRRLFRALFRDAFGYRRAFLVELSTAMDGWLEEGDVRPQWIDSIDYLAKVFDKPINRPAPPPANEGSSV